MADALKGRTAHYPCQSELHAINSALASKLTQTNSYASSTFDTDECVLVNNTLHGISTILRNFEWHEGDIIIGSRSRITILKFPYLLLFPFPMKQRTQLIMPCPERLGISEISPHTHKYLHSIFSSLPHMQIYWKTGENISAE